MHSLKHKWTITDFNEYYQHNSTLSSSSSVESSEKRLSILYSNRFPPNCDSLQFSLGIQPNSQFRAVNGISVFLHLESTLQAPCLHVKWSLAVDCVQPQNILRKEMQITFTQENNCHYFTALIPHKDIALYILPPSNCLVLHCELEMAAAPPVLIQALNQLNTLTSDSISSVYCLYSFSYRWTVKDFCEKYFKQSRENNQADIIFNSDPVSPPDNNQLKFSLVLVLKNTDPALQDYVSLYMNFASDTVRHVILNYRISLLNWKGKPYITGGFHGKLESGASNSKGTTKLIHRDELFKLSNGLLLQDKLSIFVQMEIIDININKDLIYQRLFTQYSYNREFWLRIIWYLNKQDELYKNMQKIPFSWQTLNEVFSSEEDDFDWQVREFEEEIRTDMSEEFNAFMCDFLQQIEEKLIKDHRAAENLHDRIEEICAITQIENLPHAMCHLSAEAQAKLLSHIVLNCKVNHILEDVLKDEATGIIDDWLFGLLDGRDAAKKIVNAFPKVVLLPFTATWDAELSDSSSISSGRSSNWTVVNSEMATLYSLSRGEVTDMPLTSAATKNLWLADNFADRLIEELFGEPPAKGVENAYKLLGVDQGTTIRAINIAFNNACYKNDPDNGGEKVNFGLTQLSMAIIKRAILYNLEMNR